MSAIFGIFQFAVRNAAQGVEQRMLERMRRRGVDYQRAWLDETASLGMSCYKWETDASVDTRPDVARRGHLAAVADATLYYRDDLRRRLGIARDVPNAESASYLILAAYEKWGERCVDFLEGDYACIVWDARQRLAFMARDFTGQRPLFYSMRGSTLVVASTIGAVIAHPAVRSDLNLTAIAIDASALLYSADSETCYSDVFVVPAGGAVVVDGAGAKRAWRWWNPAAETSGTKDMSRAADELRAVLGEAVLQRTAQSSTTSIWLSGGRDSTAVFAAGQHTIAQTGLGATLQPVSLRLAANDPFNEDRFIEATASHWQSSVTWLEVADLGPMIDTDRAGERDEPHGHVYENLMRKLAEKSLVTGSRVALTGHGGDFLFEVSAVILADYLASLRIPSLIREWGALGTQRYSPRALLHWGVVPIAPPIIQRWATRLRGRPLRGYFERPVPSWLDPVFVKQHDLIERARAGTPRAPNGSRAAYEMNWFLTQPRLGRLGAICAEHALESGVEQRSPILDMRVIRLAASRPASERRKDGQTKLLLRRAMIGLLPDSVLAPRSFKTGTLASYSGQAIVALAPVMCREFRDSILAALGLVRESELLKAAERLRAGTATRYMAEQLLRAFQCELWLKARTSVPRKAATVLDSQSSGRSAIPIAV